jgi:hypothetical protein
MKNSLQAQEPRELLARSADDKRETDAEAVRDAGEEEICKKPASKFHNPQNKIKIDQGTRQNGCKALMFFIVSPTPRRPENTP